MGCWDSKLLSTPRTHENENKSKSYLMPKSPTIHKKKYENIFAINPQEQQSFSSMHKLNSNLQAIVNEYEQNNGAIRSNNLSWKSFQENKENFSISSLKYREKKSQTNIQYTPDMNSSYSYEDSSSSSLKELSTNNNILLNTSLNSNFLRKKRDFYHNSRKINQTFLNKWKQEERFIISIQSKHFLTLNREEFNSGLFQLLINLYFFQEKSSLHLIAGNYIDQSYGLRVFINGIKRFFPVNKEINLKQEGGQGIKAFFKSITTKKRIKACFYLFYLTGWIPEIINLKTIKDYVGIFDRLAINFLEENVFVSFSTQSQNIQETIILKSLDPLQRTVIFIEKKFIQTNKIEYKQQAIDWQQLIKKYSVIEINWNPSIYEISLNFQILLDCKSKILEQFPQFLLKNPFDSHDIQVRILIEKHVDTFEENNEKYILELYDYPGTKVNAHDHPIRTTTFEKELCSEAFVFESSEDLSDYIIIIRPENPQTNSKTQFTVRFNSFAHISVKLIPQEKVISQTQYSSSVQFYNTGFGLNSPYFYRNIHYSLRLPQFSFIRVEIESTENHQLQLCAVCDPEQRKDISCVNIEELMKSMQEFPEIKGSGSIEFYSKCQYYIFVVVSYTKIKEKIKIKVKQIWKDNEDPVLRPFKIQIQELFFNPQFMFQNTIKWNIDDPGPRKRFKENTVPGFQPVKIFQTFFKNPYLDKKIAKGCYQFCIVSQTYTETFNENLDDDNIEELILNEAPTLSMGIFEIKENTAKIILDDAFYVPFGIGFWSEPFQLETGDYRFVFPKLQKEQAVGIFKIRPIF